MANVAKEKIEIAIEDGKQYAYFRGVKLPMLVESKVLDGCDDSFSYAELKFIVNLVKEPIKINEGIDVNKKILDNISFNGGCLVGLLNNDIHKYKDKIEIK